VTLSSSAAFEIFSLCDSAIKTWSIEVSIIDHLIKFLLKNDISRSNRKRPGFPLVFD